MFPDEVNGKVRARSFLWHFVLVERAIPCLWLLIAFRNIARRFGLFELSGFSDIASMFLSFLLRFKTGALGSTLMNNCFKSLFQTTVRFFHVLTITLRDEDDLVIKEVLPQML